MPIRIGFHAGGPLRTRSTSSVHGRSVSATRTFSLWPANAEIVERVRTGPPRWSPMRLDAVDRLVNTVEFFVHHEDVRRARPLWSPRALGLALADVLGVPGEHRRDEPGTGVGAALAHDEVGGEVARRPPLAQGRHVGADLQEEVAEGVALGACWCGARNVPPQGLEP